MKAIEVEKRKKEDEEIQKIANSYVEKAIIYAVKAVEAEKKKEGEEIQKIANSCVEKGIIYTVKSVEKEKRKKEDEEIQK